MATLAIKHLQHPRESIIFRNTPLLDEFQAARISETTVELAPYLSCIVMLCQLSL